MQEEHSVQPQVVYTLARKLVHQHGTWVPRSDMSMYCGARLYIELKEDTGKMTILSFDERGQAAEEPVFVAYADGTVECYHPGDWVQQLEALANE